MSPTDSVVINAYGNPGDLVSMLKINLLKHMKSKRLKSPPIAVSSIQEEFKLHQGTKQGTSYEKNFEITIIFVRLERFIFPVDSSTTLRQE